MQELCTKLCVNKAIQYVFRFLNNQVASRDFCTTIFLSAHKPPRFAITLFSRGFALMIVEDSSISQLFKLDMTKLDPPTLEEKRKSSGASWPWDMQFRNRLEFETSTEFEEEAALLLKDLVKVNFEENWTIENLLLSSLGHLQRKGCYGFWGRDL